MKVRTYHLNREIDRKAAFGKLVDLGFYPEKEDPAYLFLPTPQGEGTQLYWYASKMKEKLNSVARTEEDKFNFNPDEWGLEVDFANESEGDICLSIIGFPAKVGNADLIDQYAGSAIDRLKEASLVVETEEESDE